jgi:membrane-bound ClpP family serine protease
MGLSLALAYVLIIAGVLMLVGEVFLPTSGILAFVSLLAIGAGVAMTFMYGEDPSTGVVTLISVCIAVPLLASILFHYWQNARGPQTLSKQPCGR